MKKYLFIIPFLLLASPVFASSNFYNYVGGTYAYNASGTQAFNLATSTQYVLNCDSPVVQGSTTTAPLDRIVFGSGGLDVALTSTTNPSKWLFTANKFVDTNYYTFLRLGSPLNSESQCANNPMSIQDGNIPANLNAPAMKILYPQNDSITFIHDFDTFNFVATSTDTILHTYNFRIYVDSTSTFSNTSQMFSRFVQYPFIAGVTHYLSIPKPALLATSTTYYAKLCEIADYTADSNEVCADPIVFKTGLYPYGYQVQTGTAGFFGASTTESSILVPPLPDLNTGGYLCDTEFYNPANWACWAGVKFLSVFNTGKQWVQDGFSAIASDVTVVFPLSVISKFNQDIQLAQYSTSTEIGITLTGQGTAWKDGHGGYRTFTVLTASTTDVVQEKMGFDYRGFLDKIFYLLTGAIMILSAIWVLKHHSNSPHA